MTNPHTVRSFDEALASISSLFAEMGALVVGNCVAAVRSYVEVDRALALAAVEGDLDVDRGFERIRSDCFDVLLKFQPVANDLRFVMAVEHAVGDLERAGDHAKNIARRVISNPAQALSGDDARRFAELSDAVVEALRSALDALERRSAEAARRVIANDGAIDARNAAIFDAAMIELQKGGERAALLVQRLFVAKALERIGDHATNIAEEVLFLTRGVAPGGTRGELNLG